MPVDLTVKNVPDDIVERLRQRAERHHRSLQGELMVILEEATGPANLSVYEAERRLGTLGLVMPARLVDLEEHQGSQEPESSPEV